MINKLLHAVATCAVALLACIGAGCVSYSESPRGKWTVVDPTTNPPTPIEGAGLLFTFRGTVSAVVDSSEVCDYAAVRSSDGTGSIEWPAPRLSRWTMVAAYKRGYAYPFLEAINKDSKEIYLVPTRDHEMLIDQFRQVYWVSTCAIPGDTRRLVADFLGEIIPHLRAIASTPSDLKLLDLMVDRQSVMDR